MSDKFWRQFLLRVGACAILGIIFFGNISPDQMAVYVCATLAYMLLIEGDRYHGRQS